MYIVKCVSYVDNTLVIWKGTNWQIGKHNFLNQIHLRIKFTKELENKNYSINNLDFITPEDGCVAETSAYIFL